MPKATNEIVMERNMREKKRNGRGGAFIGGLFSGILLTLAIGLFGVLYMIKHPAQAVQKVMAAEAKHLVRQTVSSLPREYIQEQQGEISTVLSGFISSYASGRVSEADLDALSQRALLYASDQKIEQKEIEQMLALIRQYTR